MYPYDAYIPALARNCLDTGLGAQRNNFLPRRGGTARHLVILPLYNAISAGHAAGVIFFGENINSNISSVVVSLKAANTRSPTKLPLLLITDQEGGQVRRLPGEPVQSAKQMCGSGTAGSRGTGAGLNLKSVEMNVNLAPVLDVYRTAGDFEDQYQRSFSDDPVKGSSCGLAIILGQQATGVAVAAKHFSGLGAASAGANMDALPVTLNLSASDIRNIDELPYIAAPAIDASRPSGCPRPLSLESCGRD